MNNRKELIKMKRHIYRVTKQTCKGLNERAIRSLAQTHNYGATRDTPNPKVDIKMDDIKLPSDYEYTPPEPSKIRTDDAMRDGDGFIKIKTKEDLADALKRAGGDTKDTPFDGKSAPTPDKTDADRVSEQKIKYLIEREVKARVKEAMKPTEIVIKHETPKGKKAVKPSKMITHEAFETMLKIVRAKLNLYIVGGAGGGKTYLTEQIAKVLKIPYYFSGAISSPFQLTGFMDANGYKETAFYQAWKNGGVFVLDEIDGCSPDALLRLNAMLAGELGDFPCGMIPKHKDFFCIATANTFGRGADRVYCGRNQLDGASLDRFVMYDMQYDRALEKTFTDNMEWLKKVWDYRDAAERHNLRIIISPRATIHGSKLLAEGIDEALVEQMVIFKGLDQATIQKLKGGY